MNHPDEEIIAQHPLRAGHVEVFDQPDDPGLFRVKLFAVPHFQSEWPY